MISPIKLSTKGKLYLNPSNLIRCWSLSTTIVKSINTSHNELTASDKAAKKFKHLRVENRRKTNPETGKNFKFILNPKKHIVKGSLSPEWSTPKANNWSSAISSYNDNRKENIEFNSKWLQILNKRNYMTSPNWSSTIVTGTRKESSQKSKNSQIVLSPSNRTLLKPRKDIKKVINTDRIKLLGSKWDTSALKKPKNNNYYTHKI